MLVDKLGDGKDKVREMALNPLVDLWQVCPTDVERAIKENGLSSKNAKLKETSLEWLSRVHGLGMALSIKPYTATLVTLLEDANDGVREKAKYVVVDLFRFVSTILSTRNINLSSAWGWTMVTSDISLNPD